MSLRRSVASWGLAMAMFVPTASSILTAQSNDSSAATTPALHDLDGATGLQRLFDSEADKIRVVMLLSPT